MSLNQTFGTNATLENDGVEMQIAINEYNNEPITFTLARMSKTNKAYTKRLEIAFRPHQAAMQNETLPEALASKIMLGVFVDTILKGWSNVPKSDLTGDDADNHTQLEYNRDNAIALFTKLPDLQASLEGSARKSAAFRDAVRDQNAGN